MLAPVLAAKEGVAGQPPPSKEAVGEAVEEEAAAARARMGRTPRQNECLHEGRAGCWRLLRHLQHVSGSRPSHCRGLCPYAPWAAARPALSCYGRLVW